VSSLHLERKRACSISDGKFAGTCPLPRSAGGWSPTASRGWLVTNGISGYASKTISEIFDDDAPFSPRGYVTKIWSVAEVLLVWQAIMKA